MITVSSNSRIVSICDMTGDISRGSEDRTKYIESLQQLFTIYVPNVVTLRATNKHLYKIMHTITGISGPQIELPHGYVWSGDEARTIMYNIIEDYSQHKSWDPFLTGNFL